MKKLLIVEKALYGKRSINAIVKSVCGEMLGSGYSRDVFVLKQNPDYVVKIERNMSSGDFNNVCEFRNYVDYRDSKLFGKMLASCEMINETGQVLIQRRVEHRDFDKYPDMLPVMFSDTKWDNYGWVGKQFVCCDYPFFPFAWVKVGGSKFKKIKWIGNKPLNENQ